MWELASVASLVAVSAVVARLIRLLPAEPATQERPSVAAARRLTPWWVAAVAASTWLFVLSCEDAWGLGVLVGVGATALIVGVPGLRIARLSVASLEHDLVAEAANREYALAAKAAHDAQEVTSTAGAATASQRALLDRLRDLTAAVDAFAEEANLRRRGRERRPLVDVEHERREHTFTQYRNPLDAVRLWHNAAVEWLALDATLLLGAALVASGLVLPTSLTFGVTPNGATAIAFIALTAWSAALALVAPVAASVAMDRVEHVLRGVLIIESVLLVAALTITPSWPALVAVAVVWNCANRLGSGFSWTFKVPALTAAAVGAALISLVAHGVNVGLAFVEVAAGLAIAALISNSFTVFLPASVFVIIVLPMRLSRARKGAREDLADARGRALDAARSLAGQALETLNDDGDASRRAIATATLVRRRLDRDVPAPDAQVVASLETAIRDRIGGKELAFGEIATDDELRGARWADEDGTAALLLCEAVAVIAGEAVMHGVGRLDVTLASQGSMLRVRSENRRRDEVAPSSSRGGSAELAALITALGGSAGWFNSPQLGDPTKWSVRFDVPVAGLLR